MSERFIIDEPYVTVQAHDAVPSIIMQVYAFANREQFKQFMLAGLAYYKAHSTPQKRWGWMAHTRNMSAIPKEV